MADCGCEITSDTLSWFQGAVGDMSNRGVGLALLFYIKCSFRGFSHLLTLGLMLASCMTLSSHYQALGQKCNSTNISTEYSRCGIHPGGVHDLNCFGKYKSPGYIKCRWKTGGNASEIYHKVILQQRSKNHCRIFNKPPKLYQDIPIYQAHNLTVMVLQNPKSTNCTKAIFSATPQSLWHCGPPSNMSIIRHSGGLHVNVTWNKEDTTLIGSFIVRYKELGSLLWTESNVASQNGNTCWVKNLNSSLVYVVQVRCVSSEKCSQCLWSEPYTVAPELTTRPVIVDFKDTDDVNLKGRRLISAAWEYPPEELYDGYRVSIRKVSGEAPDEVTCREMNISEPEIRLVLSSSGYQVNISTYNNASISPAASYTIPRREDVPGVEDGKINVTAHDNSSFTIYWRDNMTQVYICYSVEWKKKGHRGLYKSFHEDSKNHRIITPLPEALEPYQKYSITLHVRPNKGTCNMKHINNSESTYGSTQFYFIEGSPVSAPTNISRHNVTVNSVVLEWFSIPEEDIRGFLRGYIIYYTEYHNKGMNTETNVTIDPQLNSYKLEELKSGTAYQVQISGFTSTGVGVRSTASFFKTNHEGSISLGHLNFSSVITVLAVVATVLIFGSPIIRRAKAVLWPSIPDPRSSNAVQNLDWLSQQELLGAIATLQVEEWDTKSFQILEKEAVIPAVTLPSLLPLLNTLEDKRDSTERTCDWIQVDEDSTPGEIVTQDIFLDTQRKELQTSPFVFTSDYTTMEMFQQLMPPLTVRAVSPAGESDTEDFTVVKSEIDYVRQFSTSPTSDSEDMTTIL